MILRVPEKISDRTTFLPEYEALLDQSLSDFGTVSSLPRNKVFSRQEQTKGSCYKRSTLSSNDVERQIKQPIVGISLIEAEKKIKLYIAVIESLQQQVLMYEQTIRNRPLKTENEFDDNSLYIEKHESPEVIRAFLSVATSFPLRREENFPVYTDEELDLF